MPKIQLRYIKQKKDVLPNINQTELKCIKS